MGINRSINGLPIVKIEPEIGESIESFISALLRAARNNSAEAQGKYNGVLFSIEPQTNLTVQDFIFLYERQVAIQAKNRTIRAQTNNRIQNL